MLSLLQGNIGPVEGLHAAAVAPLPPDRRRSRLVHNLLGPRRVLLLHDLHLPNGGGDHPRLPGQLPGAAAQGEEARPRPPGNADGPARR